MTKINKSWREQRKAVLSTDEVTGFRNLYISVWEAAKEISEKRAISHGTARKEIRRAIKTGAKRYGCYWTTPNPNPFSVMGKGEPRTEIDNK